MSSFADVNGLCCLLTCTPNASDNPIVLTILTGIGYFALFFGIFITMKDSIAKNLMKETVARVEGGEKVNVMLIGPIDNSDEINDVKGTIGTGNDYKHALGKIVAVSHYEGPQAIYQVKLDSGEVEVPHSSIHLMTKVEVAAQKKYNKVSLFHCAFISL
jgi:hypothetical protein